MVYIYIYIYIYIIYWEKQLQGWPCGHRTPCFLWINYNFEIKLKILLFFYFVTVSSSYWYSIWDISTYSSCSCPCWIEVRMYYVTKPLPTYAQQSLQMSYRYVILDFFVVLTKGHSHLPWPQKYVYDFLEWLTIFLLSGGQDSSKGGPNVHLTSPLLSSKRNRTSHFLFLYRLAIPGFQPEDKCFVTFPPDPATLPFVVNSSIFHFDKDIVYYAPNNTNSSMYCVVFMYTRTCTCTVLHVTYY